MLGHTLEISVAMRARSTKGDLAWQRDTEALACHKGIWDEGVGFPGSSKAEQIAELNRRNKCYFWPYQPGLLLPSADALQREAAARAADTAKYRLAIYALILTIIGLVITLIAGKA